VGLVLWVCRLEEVVGIGLVVAPSRIDPCLSYFRLAWKTF
jgi:hypothetical protein